MKRAVVPVLFHGLAVVERCQRGSPSQLPDTFPAVSSLPLWHKLQDLIDRLVLFAGSELDPGDQQLIDGRQQARVDCGLIPSALDNTGHTELSQPLVGNPGKNELAQENWRQFLTVISFSTCCPLPSPD